MNSITPSLRGPVPRGRSNLTKELVLGTGNPDKLKELRRLLKPLRLRVVPITAFGKVPRVVEDGRTFEQNASKKARVYSLWAQKLTLADDSGLAVDALRGKPGVYSARFAGPGCTYADNNRKLLRLLAGKTGAARGATFRCVIALYDNGRRVAVFRGAARGRIAPTPAGANGFGYDPIFIPNGFQKTFAQLTPAQKNHLSHRGKALRAALRFLKSHLR